MHSGSLLLIETTRFPPVPIPVNFSWISSSDAFSIEDWRCFIAFPVAEVGYLKIIHVSGNKYFCLILLAISGLSKYFLNQGWSNNKVREIALGINPGVFPYEEGGDARRLGLSTFPGLGYEASKGPPPLIFFVLRISWELD